MQARKRLEEAIANDERVRGLTEELDTLFELAREGEKVEPDIERSLKPYAELLERLENAMLLSGENAARSAIVTIHPGAGGTESQDWAEMLLRMYLRWAEREGFQTLVTDRLEGDGAGIKSVTFEVNGESTYGLLQSEIGVHRLVRISPFDANARRHTSFASVFVFPQVDDEIKIDIQEKDLRIDTFRASGAGGQHVNMTDSAVRITHFPTNIVVQCQNERSQHKNKASAMKVLKSRLYDLKMKENQSKLAEIAGVKKEIGFGSQIRSYVLQPYQMIKDHRTKMEVGDISKVLDYGDLDPFIKTYLLKKASGTLGAAAPADEE
jgi:peptide chain release factor 2